nr:MULTISPECIES: hypothetical protein [Spiroplasma]
MPLIFFRYIIQQELLEFPQEIMIGSLINYIINASPDNFQPMKANFGIIPDFADQKFKSKLEKYQAYGSRLLTALENFIKENKI